MKSKKVTKKEIKKVMKVMPDCFGYYGLGSEQNDDDTVCERCSFGDRCVETGNI